MLSWTERRVFAYTPPDDAAPPPMAPRAKHEAHALDGARLEAFVFGTPLAPPMALELRRYGVPAPELDDATAAPEFPRLEELQDAADELLPPGTMLSLVLIAQPPGGAAAATLYHSVTAVQFAQLQAMQRTPAVRS